VPVLPWPGGTPGGAPGGRPGGTSGGRPGEDGGHASAAAMLRRLTSGRRPRLARVVR